MEVLQQHVNSPLPPLPHSLARYEHLLNKLVAKNRTERFTQAERDHRGHRETSGPR